MVRALLLAAISLAGCSSPEEVADRTGVAAGALASSRAAATASTAEGGAWSESTDAYTFEYAYPGEAAVVPALVRWLDSDAAQARADLAGDAEGEKVAVEADGFPYKPHSYSMEWKVVADLPGWLSLSGEFWTYSGGAHGMYGTRSLVWNKDRKVGFEGVALFASAAALDGALGAKLCAALNSEREKRRGEPVRPGSDDMFDQCVGVDEATLLLGSSNGKTFDRLGVWIGPYVAGPYAEGAFELDFPVDQAVLAAVKPEYREAFSVKR